MDDKIKQALLAPDAHTKMVIAQIRAGLRRHMPVFLIGAPGTSKTATVNSLATSLDKVVISLVGSRMEPTDVGGLPKASTMTFEDGEVVEATVYLAPWWQVEILRLRKVVLFLDEFSNSSPAVQAAFLTIIQDRRFPDGTPFPEETVVMGASNPASEAADGYEMSLPITNRIMWMAWNPTTKSWIEGMKVGFGQDLPKEEMKWKRLIAGFIKESPQWLHKMPDGTTGNLAVYGLNQDDASTMEAYQNAWPSRRSWDNLSRVLGGLEEGERNDTSLQDALGQSIVGYSATAELREYLRKHNSISPQEVMDDPTSIDWVNMTIDDSNRILRALLKDHNAENSAKIINVFKVMAEANRADLGAAYVTELFRKSMTGMPAEIRQANRKACSEVATLYQSVSSNAR